MPNWLATTVGVLSALGVVSALVVTPLYRWGRAYTSRIEERLAKMDATLDQIADHFDSSSEVAKLVGTLPERVARLERRPNSQPVTTLKGGEP